MFGAKSIVSGEIRAVVTRADGTVQDLGLVAYYHRNPLKMLAYKASVAVKGIISWLPK